MKESIPITRLECMAPPRLFPASMIPFAALLASWRLDAKLGVRMLVKYPGLALIGGAGIAAAVAIAAGGFSVVHGNLLASSLPLEQGERIVSLGVWDSAGAKPERRNLYEFHLWRESLKSVEETAAFQTLTRNLIVPGGPPESVRVAAMTASGFAVARVRPLLGRVFTEADERPGSPPVAIIGESVWRSRFGSDPAILGRTIQFGSVPHSIAGVMPKDFAFPVNHRFWVPLRTGAAPPEPLTGPELRVFGRLAPGATLESAGAELSAASQRTALLFPKLYAPLRPTVTPYPRSILNLQGPGDMAGILAMQGFVLALLVLVCLNVAILVFTRTAMRQTEFGLRTALGAARGRIVAQLFVEALVLSSAASLAGVALAAAGLRYVSEATRPIASELPFWLSFRLAPEAVVYSCVLAILAAAIVGVVPALQSTGRRIQTGIRISGGSGMRLGKTWTVLIVAQTAFAVALLPPAVINAWRDLRVALAGPGFAAGKFLSAQLTLESEGSEPDRRVPVAQVEFFRRLSAHPSAGRVTFAQALPGDEPGFGIEAEGRPGEVLEARVNRVDAGFFRAFDVPILAGRGFETSDEAPARAGEPPRGGAVVVNQQLAQRMFGGNALGRRIRYRKSGGNSASTDAGPGRWYEIVGVVSDFPTGVSTGMRDSALKLYHVAAPGELESVALAIEVRGPGPATFGQSLREIAASVDPDLNLREIRGLDDALRREQWIVRLEAGVLMAVTASALLLSSAGIYSLMSFTVSRRQKEIGIRMALGASRLRILGGVFSRALLQLGSGAMIGAALGYGFERASGGDLMQGNAPAVLAAVALAMLATGLLATVGPARRGLGIEPIQSLREQ